MRNVWGHLSFVLLFLLTLSTPVLGESNPVPSGNELDTYRDCAQVIEDSVMESLAASNRTVAQLSTQLDLPAKVTFAELVASLALLSCSYRDIHLDAPLIAVDFKTNIPRCTSTANKYAPYLYDGKDGRPLAYLLYNSRTRAWFDLSRIAIGLYQGSRIMAEANFPAFAATLKNDFLTVVQHIIANQNATDLEGLTSAAVDPERGYMGWNNLFHGWDAFNNRTCTNPTRPTLYDTAWSLLTIAVAFSVTRDSFYADAFKKGAAYFHVNKPSAVYGPDYNYDNAFTNIQSRLGQGKVFSAFSMGVGDPVGTPEDRLTIRYHYTTMDPGRYVGNTQAIMSLALAIFGKASPTSAFRLPTTDGTSRTVLRTFTNVGYYGEIPQFLSASQASPNNESYYDKFDYQANALVSSYVDPSMLGLGWSSQFFNPTQYPQAGNFRTKATALTVSRVLRYNDLAAELKDVELRLVRPSGGPAITIKFSGAIGNRPQTLAQFVASWNSANPVPAGGAPLSLIGGSATAKTIGACEVVLVPVAAGSSEYKGKFSFGGACKNYVPNISTACAFRQADTTGTLRAYCNARADVQAGVPPEPINIFTVTMRPNGILPP